MNDKLVTIAAIIDRKTGSPLMLDALKDLLAAIEADQRVKRGDYFAERKAARSAITAAENGDSQ